jgi:hypothetical protein
LIHHSDRGSTYASYEYEDLLNIHRSSDCEYEILFGSETIRDVCEISTPEGWRTADEWTLLVKDPDMSADPEIAPNDFFFYLSKGTLDGSTYYSISWNANDAGQPAYIHAQWNLGEDYTYTKDPERDIHTIEGHDTEIVLNFEVSLQKYPQPELIDLSTYAPEAVSNWDMLFTMNELIIMHRARLRQLMKLKIDQIKSFSTDHDYTVQNVEAALKAQEAWEAYASARSDETSAGVWTRKRSTFRRRFEIPRIAKGADRRVDESGFEMTESSDLLVKFWKQYPKMLVKRLAHCFQSPKKLFP